MNSDTHLPADNDSDAFLSWGTMTTYKNRQAVNYGNGDVRLIPDPRRQSPPQKTAPLGGFWSLVVNPSSSPLRPPHLG